MRSIETVLFLVVLATVVATFAGRFRIPAPSLLVVAGIGVGLLPGVPAIRVTPEVVSVVVLPPLLYAAGEELSWRDLRAVWRPVSVLAIGLVLASAAAVGAVAAAIAPLPAGMAFVLGAVLASTDPVAVTALGRRLSLPARVQTLVQAESLFNDATSLVLFRVAVSVAVVSGGVTWGHAAGQFVLLAGGGAAVGALTAGGVALIRRRIEDPVLETVVALVTPYAGYVLAEALHTSGVTAVVIASVILGAQTGRLTNAGIRLQVHAVYAVVVFLLESVVFALIGLQLPTLLRALTRQETWWALEALALTATLLVVRAAWVFPLSFVLARRGGGRGSWRVPAVVSWAGARGVLPLAAALSIPLTSDAGVPLPGRDLVLLLTTAVIVLTLTVQGFTLEPLVRRTGIALAAADTRDEDSRARLSLARAALAHLEQIAELEAVPDFAVGRLRHDLEARIETARLDQDTERPGSDPAADVHRQLRQALLAVENAELTRLYDAGEISDATRRQIQRTLDLEGVGLGGD